MLFSSFISGQATRKKWLEGGRCFKDYTELDATFILHSNLGVYIFYSGTTGVYGVLECSERLGTYNLSL